MHWFFLIFNKYIGRTSARGRTSIRNNMYFHIYNRCIEGRDLFLDDYDFERFRQGLYYFNSVDHFVFRENYFLLGKDWEIKCQSDGKRLVSVLSYILLPNHFHLYVYTENPGNLTNFIRKQMTGYTMYFNTKYSHEDRIFASKTKVKIIDSDGYYYHMPNYIHLNALDLLNKDWRLGLSKWNNCKSFLEDYKWSSLFHYLGMKKDPILDNEWIKQYLQDCSGKYMNELRKWAQREIV